MAYVGPRRFERGRLDEAVEVVTDQGTAIYVLPVRTFPGHTTNAVLVDHPEHRLMVDPGTPRSHRQLLARFDEIAERFEVRTALHDVDEVLLSHGHMDHYADAWALRRQGISIAVHELEARVLERFEERRALMVRDLEHWLAGAGVDEGGRQRLCATYTGPKPPFDDMVPDRRLRDGDTIGDGWRVIHTPGHSPGHVCLAVDDVLIAGDHLLSRTTPVQTPATLVTGCGLAAYLGSLVRLRQFGPFDVGIGAHDDLMDDVEGRVLETLAHHKHRLREVHALCEQPSTTAQLARALFEGQKAYGVLLALMETGAHVEHLHRLALLEVDNLEEVVADPRAPVRWRARKPRA